MSLPAVRTGRVRARMVSCRNRSVRVPIELEIKLGNFQQPQANGTTGVLVKSRSVAICRLPRRIFSQHDRKPVDITTPTLLTDSVYSLPHDTNKRSMARDYDTLCMRTHN